MRKKREESKRSKRNKLFRKKLSKQDWIVLIIVETLLAGGGIVAGIFIPPLFNSSSPSTNDRIIAFQKEIDGKSFFVKETEKIADFKVGDEFDAVALNEKIATKITLPPTAAVVVIKVERIDVAAKIVHVSVTISSLQDKTLELHATFSLFGFLA